jgi:2-iminobutanoate/2-iminopropanoate deaminase
MKKKSFNFIFLSLFLFAACQAPTAEAPKAPEKIRKVIDLQEAGLKAIGPYSTAVLAENTLYVSGQIPINPQTGDLLPDSLGIQAQAKQVLANLKTILAEAEMTPEEVVKVSIFLRNMDDYAAVNEVYAEFFAKPFPAREVVQVARLPKDVALEISCIAVKK